jgi:phosphoglycerate dehydrogenase-like enzyme
MAVAERARGLGMNLLGSDPFVTAEQAALRGVEVVPLETLLERSDAVTVHVPLSRSTTALLDAKSLARMRPGAFVLNVARGGIVDETALADALRDGRLGGAALDVWWQYPDAAEPERRGSRHPFHALPNVIVTPHNSGWTQGMVRRRWDEVADNIGRFARGERPINLVTTT